MKKVVLIGFSLLLSLSVNPSKVKAIQLQGSPVFILGGSGNFNNEGWQPRRLLINGTPRQRIELKVNTTSSLDIEATSCGAVFVPIDLYKNSTGTIKVDGQSITINDLPTQQTPQCRFGQFISPRPVNYITRPDGSADGRYVVIVGKQFEQNYKVEIPQQANVVIPINACGWGLLPERIRTRRDKYGEIISRELVGLPENFRVNNQTYDLRSLPISNSLQPPFCRTIRNTTETYVPQNW